MAASSTRYRDKTGQMPFGLYFGPFKFLLPFLTAVILSETG